MLQQSLHLWAALRLCGIRCVDAGNKVHPAEKALFQRHRFLQTAQLVQQDHLRCQRAQRHLDSVGFIHPADALQRRQGLLRLEKLAPLVHHCYQTLPLSQRLVAVVDERNELFPPEQPLPPLERIGGVDKARAVQMALRTLAPQVILLDELGGLEETRALEQGFFSGVDFIASLHAPDAAQAQCRPQVQALLQRGMLRQLVVLAGRETPGCIREVCAV